MNSEFNQPEEALLENLKAVVGEKNWIPGADGSRYYDDPRGRFTGQGCLIVLPDTTEQVAAIVRLCNDAKVAIVPFGGGTGVVAGQMFVDSPNAIIVSLERMNKVRELSAEDGVIVVEAGCILENIHTAASKENLMFPLSMASKGSCSIGGNLATNAGGIQVVRHGNARDLCLGVEAILPCGSIYSDLSPLRKDNTGYDLRHLLIGSEGTLGIITAATLILKPMDPETVTVFCAVSSPSEALRLYRGVRQHLGESISALELMSGFGLELVTEHFPNLSKPFTEDHAWYLLIEASGPVGIIDRAQDALADCLENELLLDAVIAQSEAQRQALWDLRENTPEANRAGGAFCNSDTSVPISKVGAFIERTTQLLLEINPDVQINTYGHIGDGNIHHNVLPPRGISKADFLAVNAGIIDQVRLAINDATVAFSGSISAEHGIGRLKTSDLEIYGDATKRETLKKIKAAMDPNNIMNPGAITG